MARDLGADARRTLLAAVERAGVPLLEGRSFADTVRDAAAALGLQSGGAKLLINVGGAQLALGECPEAEHIPPGLITRTLPCSGSTPGLVHIASQQGIAVLNIFKIRELAQRYGLPLDPVPLPPPGRNRSIYGAARRKAPMPLPRSSS
jgi:poly-gamma-glutamate system protein